MSSDNWAEKSHISDRLLRFRQRTLERQSICRRAVAQRNDSVSSGRGGICGSRWIRRYENRLVRGKGVYGKLAIIGKRLDAVGPPLRAEIPNGYRDTGFQPSEVIFPTEGCWQVTGTVAAASVTFVTRVVKLPGLKPNASDN